MTNIKRNLTPIHRIYSRDLTPPDYVGYLCNRPGTPEGLAYQRILEEATRQTGAEGTESEEAAALVDHSLACMIAYLGTYLAGRCTFFPFGSILYSYARSQQNLSTPTNHLSVRIQGQPCPRILCDVRNQARFHLTSALQFLQRSALLGSLYPT